MIPRVVHVVPELGLRIVPFIQYRGPGADPGPDQHGTVLTVTIMTVVLGLDVGLHHEIAAIGEVVITLLIIVVALIHVAVLDLVVVHVLLVAHLIEMLSSNRKLLLK